MVAKVSMTPDVMIMFGNIDSLDLETYHDDEINSLGARATQKRRREFIAGRVLARKLLDDNGINPSSIPILPNRLPSWPDGIVASISHTDTHVAVAIAKAENIKTVGIDIECQNAVTEELHAEILTREELTTLKSSSLSATKYFSAKEATFKACFAMHNEYFDFTDIVIEFSDDSYAAMPNRRLQSNTSLLSGIGMTSCIDGHELCMFFVRP